MTRSSTPAVDPLAFALHVAKPNLDERLVGFLDDNVRSIQQVEVLVTLARDPSRVWSPGDLGRDLNFAIAEMTEALAHLLDRELVGATTERERRFFYAPRTIDDHLAVQLLVGLRATSAAEIYAVVRRGALARLKNGAARLVARAFGRFRA
jgi:hypothetical protein